MILTLPVLWEGPYGVEDVVGELARDEDHGLYQVYGTHPDSLLYIGSAIDRTFAERLGERAPWSAHAEVRVHVGRLFAPERYRSEDGRASWERDVRLAERVMIHKYSPRYNGASAGAPSLRGFAKVVLEHEGPRRRIQPRDVAPDDWQPNQKTER